ncbi:MAG: hypothetical protein ABI665_07805 [Vicinamibacterales bacterium]
MNLKSPVAIAVAAGLLLGVVYTLSPLTVLCLGALVPLAGWASRGLSARERRWFFGLLALAIALRLIAIGALFLFADPSQPYANFFGDEELFKSRTVWLRNTGLGIPISPADMIYVFDDVGQSSHLYLLAYVQALVGAAPYGNNVLNACLFVAAAVVLYRFVRPALGGVPALAGFAFLCFLPSLFSWSVSVLKEPLYILVAAIEISCAAQILRGRTGLLRVLAFAGVVLCGYALGSLRAGGMVLAAAGTIGGCALALILARPRRALVSLMVAPIILVAALMQPRIQDRVMENVRYAAFQHWGHIATPGFTYELLDPEFYVDGERRSVLTMTPSQAGRFVIRALASYSTVPVPWQIESRTALAFLPEQIIWYGVILLLPFGLMEGVRRDALVTGLLACHALGAVIMVALSGGNVGTLIRHRGLALPYLVFLAALGGCALVRQMAARAGARSAESSLGSTGEPAWP